MSETLNLFENSDYWQSLFDEAYNEFQKGNNKEFISTIKRLNNTLTCNCFLTSQDKKKYSDILSRLGGYNQNTNSYLIKGFAYLFNNEEENAMSNLLQWLEYSKYDLEGSNFDDFTFSLLGSINHSINEKCVEHAERAVILNPSPRNYYILANSYINNKDISRLPTLDLKNSLFFFKKVIELNPNFACAYNKLGNIYTNLKKYKEAIKYFKLCTKIDLNHTSYKVFWYCYIKLQIDIDFHPLWRNKKSNKSFYYEEALNIAKQGFKLHPNDGNYFYLLGYSYWRLYNYEKAVDYLSKFDNIYPNTKDFKNRSWPIFSHYPIIDYTKLQLNYCKGILNEKKRKNALVLFDDADYLNYIKIFEESIIDCPGHIDDKESVKYLTALLKTKDSNINIDESNPKYIDLTQLRESYRNKKNTNTEISSDEENASKLTVYYWDWILKFGKYKGKTISEMIDIDPHYILWCIINLKHFSVIPDLLVDNHFVKNSYFLSAVETNLIKYLIIYGDEEDYDDDYYEPEEYEYQDYGPGAYGYSSWEEMSINEAFEGNSDLYYQHYW